MAIKYRIDRELGFVFSEFSGVLTDEELIVHQQSVASEPGFRSDFNQLVDARAVTALEATPDGVRRLAAGNRFGKGAKRAFVTDNDTVLGMARMYELRRVDPQDEFRVFRSMAEARAWLGLPPENPPSR